MGPTWLEFVSISAYLQIHFVLICILIVLTVVCDSQWWCMFTCLHLSSCGQWHTLKCVHKLRVLWGCVSGWLLHVEWVCGMCVELSLLCAAYKGGRSGCTGVAEGLVCVALCLWRLYWPALPHRTSRIIQQSSCWQQHVLLTAWSVAGDTEKLKLSWI